MMMALSGGAGAPALNDVQAEPVAKYGDHGHKEYRLFGRRRGGCCGGGGGCHGGGGCYGGGYGGCCGSGYGGGCYGGGYGGCSGGVIYGSCSGGGYGGCSGGYGGYSGGCSGGGYYGSLSGGYYGAMPIQGGYYSAMPYEGGYSYSAPSGYPIYSSGTIPSQGTYQYGWPFDAVEGSNNYYDSNSSAPATIVVSVPADAKLTFDGNATQSSDSVRTFTSPPLQPGKDYQYTLRAEVTRDGKKVERTREVNVRAGQTSQVNIDFAEQLAPPNTKNK
jgi:uncharacterized protein (TIGR03000 family)